MDAVSIATFQADFGFDTAFGAAGVNDYLETGLGYRRIRDYQYFVPFGGRAILPFASERFHIARRNGRRLHALCGTHQPAQRLLPDRLSHLLRRVRVGATTDW
jgi:hypothetical protein